MKTATRFCMIAILCVASLGLSSCKDPYGSSAKAGADIAQSITGAFNTISQLEQQGLITPHEAVNAAGYFEYANKADEAFLTCVAAAHTAGGIAGSFTSCATAFNTSLNNPTELALLHISNTKASGNISVIVNGLTAAAQLIITQLKGA